MLRVENLVSSRMEWCTRMVRSCNSEQMFAQWRGNREKERLAGLADGEANFVTAEVDLRPSEGGEISEPLTSIDAELDEALPFFVGDSEDGAQLVQGEGAALEVSAILNRLNGFCRVLEQIAIHSRGAEDPAYDLEIVIGGRGSVADKLCVTEGADLRARDVFDAAGAWGPRKSRNLLAASL